MHKTHGMNENQPIPLTGVVQHYAWGGYEYIPALIGQTNAAREPFAELWMGVHGRGPARLQLGASTPLLSEWLGSHPEALGAARHRFGEQLPFLFKILDVREMLSIQSHPTKAQAEAGFRRENEAGISLEAPHRNFKDANHKPEVMVALTDFWLLHGFRPRAEIQELLESNPAFRPLQPYFGGQSIYSLYKAIMELPQARVDELLQPLYGQLQQAERLEKSSPGYWARRAFEQYSSAGFDRGIFSIYLFNLVHVAPGAGIYQGAGIPHAYLEGVNVELMANSDNVFRGGLTVKHIDVPQLLQHLHFDSVAPKILTGQHRGAWEVAYETPAPDFQLNRIDLPAGSRYEPTPPPTAEIAIVLQGGVRTGDGQVFSRGQSFFLPAGTAYTLTATETAELFKALVPTGQNQ